MSPPELSSCKMISRLSDIYFFFLVASCFLAHHNYNQSLVYLYIYLFQFEYPRRLEIGRLVDILTRTISVRKIFKRSKFSGNKNIQKLFSLFLYFLLSFFFALPLFLSAPFCLFSSFFPSLPFFLSLFLFVSFFSFYLSRVLSWFGFFV